MDSVVLHDCLTLAFAGRMTFPETVGRMLETGVERYDADLHRLQKTHYGTDGTTHVEPMPLGDAPAIPAGFSPGDVQAAIEAIQGRQIEYPEFLRRIMVAGTASYSVYLGGRKAIYFGRNGDFHVEPFPHWPVAARQAGSGLRAGREPAEPVHRREDKQPGGQEAETDREPGLPGDPLAVEPHRRVAQQRQGKHCHLKGDSQPADDQHDGHPEPQEPADRFFRPGMGISTTTAWPGSRSRNPTPRRVTPSGIRSL